MSTAVCLAFSNPQQFHEFLFLPREDFCVREEDLLEMLIMQDTLFTSHGFWPSTATFMEEMCFVIPSSLFHCGSGYV